MPPSSLTFPLAFMRGSTLQITSVGCTLTCSTDSLQCFISRLRFYSNRHYSFNSTIAHKTMSKPLCTAKPVGLNTDDWPVTQLVGARSATTTNLNQFSWRFSLSIVRKSAQLNFEFLAVFQYFHSFYEHGSKRLA